MNTLPPYALAASKSYQLMQEQARRGVCFDIEAAKLLHIQIDTRIQAIEAEVNPQLPGRPLNSGEMKAWTPPKIQFKNDGSPSAACRKWFDSVRYSAERGKWYGAKVVAEWNPEEALEFQLPFNEPITHILPMTIANQGALKDWVISLGWKPTIWNYKQISNGPGKKRLARDDRGKLIKTTPKFHDKGRVCPGLERLGEKFTLVHLIAEYMSLRNRRSTLWNEEKGTGWLANKRLAFDGRLPSASSGLTNTKRQKHTIIANVPRVGTLMGAEMRSLFVASPGKVMVGADANGLEARIKGHFTYAYDGGEYARKLLDPDFDEHSENAALWDCSRNDAKSPGYALQYNAQAPKFSETLGVPLKLGQAYYDAYWETNWALRSAIEETEGEFDKNFQKYITTIDGSKIVTRARHSVFNAKCQSAGAKLMDMAGILLEDSLQDTAIDAERLIYYHDEYQYEVAPAWADDLGALMCVAIERAGEHFQMNVPFAGAYTVGKNWAETH
jgi:hypothetical protein